MNDRPSTPLLDQVNIPADLRKLKPEQLRQLADELRAETISAVGTTGGHLGSGLGVVELTNVGNRIQSATFQPIATLTTVAVTYLLLTTLVTQISNAIAYSPNGSTVSISRCRRGDMVEIAVTDRGIGIALADQERVFERFFRVDKARSRATGIAHPLGTPAPRAIVGPDR